MTRLALLVIATLAAGCGMKAEWSNPGVYRCTDGRVIDLSEWTPYAGIAGRGWIENNRTGERIEDDGTLKCTERLR